MIYCVDLTHYLLISQQWFPLLRSHNEEKIQTEVFKFSEADEEHKEMQIQEEEIKLLKRSSKVRKYFLREQEKGEKKTVFE